MTIKEFLSDINGIDVETRKPKSAVTFQLQNVNLANEKVTLIESLSLHKPTIEVKRRGDYMEINLIFTDEKDINLRRIWNMFQEYGRLMNNLPEEPKNMPQLLSMIVPVKSNGEKFIHTYKPIFWAPKPKAPGLKSLIFSVLCEVNNMYFVDNMDIDLTDALAEADRELKAENELRAKDL